MRRGKPYATPGLPALSVQVLGEEGSEGLVGEFLGLGEQSSLRGRRERISRPERLALGARAPKREDQIPLRRVRAALRGHRHAPATVAVLYLSPGHRRLHEVGRKGRPIWAAAWNQVKSRSALACSIVSTTRNGASSRQVTPTCARRARVSDMRRRVPQGIAVKMSGI